MSALGETVKNDDDGGSTGDPLATVAFERDRLTVSAAGDEVIEVALGDRVYHASANDGHASVAIPYGDLYAMPTLEARIGIGHPGALRSVAVPMLLQQIDIRSSREFGERVQSMRKRMTDNEAVRFASRRRLLTADASFDDHAAAICAIGYRILERRDPADSDIAFVRKAARDTLAGAGRDERHARWITSITMVLSYLAVLVREAEEAERQLIETLSYRPFLPQLSLLHTNFSRANLLLALVRAARSDAVGTEAALNDVDEVFRVGVRSSWIDHNIRGRSQFSEIFAVLKVARLAAELRSELQPAIEGDRLAAFAAAAPMTSISPIVKALQIDGHWQAVLDHNSNSRAAIANRKKWAMANVG